MISESESSAAAACASAPLTGGAPYAGTRNPAKPCFSATLLTPSLTPLEPESCAESWGSALGGAPDLPPAGGRDSEPEDIGPFGILVHIAKIRNLEDTHLYNDHCRPKKGPENLRVVAISPHEGAEKAKATEPTALYRPTPQGPYWSCWKILVHDQTFHRQGRNGSRNSDNPQRSIACLQAGISGLV